MGRVITDHEVIPARDLHWALRPFPVGACRGRRVCRTVQQNLPVNDFNDVARHCDNSLCRPPGFIERVAEHDDIAPSEASDEDRESLDQDPVTFAETGVHAAAVHAGRHQNEADR
jgi:hypothetical protein